MPFHTHRLDTALHLPPQVRQPRSDQNLLISDATVPHLERAVRNAFLNLRSNITDQIVYRGMSSGSLGAEIAGALHQFQRDLGSTKVFLANAHMQAMHITGRHFTVRKEQLVQFDLDQLPQPTQDALNDYDFGLIREVTDDVRNTISGVMSRGIQDGWAPAKMARNLRGSIGLTDSQEQAVENYRSLLENADPDALQRALRDKRSDGVVQDAVDGVRPLSQSTIERLVGNYEDRYLNYRANTIARYESLLAANTGSSDAIQSAIDDGTLDESQVTTYWLINDDELTCPLCRSIVELQPDGVPYGASFQWSTVPKSKRGKPKSGLVTIAPAHPLCRCTNTFRITGGQ